MFLHGFLTFLLNQGLLFLYIRYGKISIFTNIEKTEQAQWELNQVIIIVSTLSGFHLPLVISEIADKST